MSFQSLDVCLTWTCVSQFKNENLALFIFLSFVAILYSILTVDLRKEKTFNSIILDLNRNIHFSDSSKFQTSSVELLDYIKWDINAISAAKGIEILLAGLDRYTDRAELCYHIVTAIHKILDKYSDDHHDYDTYDLIKYCVDNRICKLLDTLIVCHLKNSMVLKKEFDLIFYMISLVFRTKNTEFISDFGENIIPVFINVLSNPIEDNQIKTQVVYWMSRFLFKNGEKFANIYKDLGVIPLCNYILRTHILNEKLCENICDLLQEIFYHIEQTDVLIEDIVYKSSIIISDVFKQYLKNESIVSSLCKIIIFVVNNSEQEKQKIYLATFLSLDILETLMITYEEFSKVEGDYNLMSYSRLVGETISLIRQESPQLFFTTLEKDEQEKRLASCDECWFKTPHDKCAHEIEHVCPICYNDTVSSFTALPCGHVIHEDCFRAWVALKTRHERESGDFCFIKSECPKCRNKAKLEYRWGGDEEKRVYTPIES
jgi:hypothetical protein